MIKLHSGLVYINNILKIVIWLLLGKETVIYQVNK